jgi:predicted nucleic acid-binding protein
VDANIVVAAFLRDSTVRRVIALSFIDLFVPEFLHEELAKHAPLLRKRAGVSEGAASELLRRIEGYFKTVPREALLPHWSRAASCMAPIDPRDTAYLATALAIPCEGIWSDDPHLKAQRLVPCWSTKELLVALRADGLKL